MRIGIMTAIDQELEIFRSHLHDFEKVDRLRRSFWSGALCGHDIALTKCGVGKVRAAACTQYLIDRYEIEALIFAGVAGGLNPRLSVGDVVISGRTIQHDYDTSTESLFNRILTRWYKADDRLIEAARQAAESHLGKNRVLVGSVLTGDQAITKQEKKEWLRETFGGDCVEMEGAAAGQVCSMNGVPFVLIRTISDLADGNALKDFRASINTVVETSARIVMGMVELLP